MNDTEALESALAGRVDGFNAIFANHASFLFTHALRILKSRESAEDAVQETFTAAFRALGSFMGNSRLRPWLYRIMFNSPLIIPRQKTPLPLPDEIALASDTEKTITRLDVSRVLDILPERDRTLLILAYWDESSIKEIAEILAISESNVKISLFRARNRFAGIWNDLFSKENSHAV